MGGRPKLSYESAQVSREQFSHLFAALAAASPPKPDSIKEEVVQITPERYVKIYTPAQASGQLPVGLYVHSGGWYAGAVEFEDGLCRDIVQRSNIILFSPEYGLAPENPFPDGLNDVCKAYEWMHENASKYGGDPTRKAVMGGSAGANLSACVAVKYASDHALRPSAILLGAMASCDPRALPDEYRRRLTPEKYKDLPMISTQDMITAREWLNAPPDDPLHSCLLHPSVKLLPQTYIAACTNDPTYQETMFFYEECKKHGVVVEVKEFVGWPHFFWGIPTLAATEVFQSVWCQKLNEMLETAAAS
ncbi:uncharacterized protein HMPREF1541_08479 [Cyphellophora europaea CBS 101466]|uniref:Alpha/beta hydrolase fold-3 domain-containing protein n=1 Tax=Cyphellophora europaea (strain CBS 101466) TaxID=1220924 RepID=W2RI55_CYPE1|nr:uncharacterized protein HMPREF1541_08479 [Cyphellophora europaea CBS 101466]ETN36202.1 hypothetical protein HMPREF1541_08479 [Cyphellophora europaea CBS 101466]